MKTRNWAVVLGIVCLAGIANASSATILADDTSSSVLVFGITTATTTGATMTGLQVTVTFTGGGTSTALFTGGCGTDCGSASSTSYTGGTFAGGGSWSLAQTGDTGAVSDFTNINGTPVNFWTLTNATGLNITSVMVMGGPLFGNVVFDRDSIQSPSTVRPLPGVQVGTPGSSIGIDFVANTTSVTPPSPPPADTGSYAVNVTYSSIVKFFSSAACSGASFGGLNAATTGCGDTWQNIKFDFTTAFSGTSGSPVTFHFFQDTDMVGTPEPFTLGLTTIGLLSILAYRRRRSAGRFV